MLCVLLLVVTILLIVDRRHRQEHDLIIKLHKKIDQIIIKLEKTSALKNMYRTELVAKDERITKLEESILSFSRIK
jgi:hypothetical protein